MVAQRLRPEVQGDPPGAKPLFLLQVTEKRARDRSQALQRVRIPTVDRQQRAVARMASLPDRLNQVLLAGKMSVDAARAQAGFPDDVLNRCLMKSLARKACLGGVQDFVASC